MSSRRQPLIPGVGSALCGARRRPSPQSLTCQKRSGWGLPTPCGVFAAALGQRVGGFTPISPCRTAGQPLPPEQVLREQISLKVPKPLNFGFSGRKIRHG